MLKKLSLLLALPAAFVFAQTPVFAPPVPIMANGAPINVGYGGNASPFIVDWDGDGRQDLLLGQYDGGKIRFYQNTGTNFAPVFGDSAYLQADGVDIALTSG